MTHVFQTQPLHSRWPCSSRATDADSSGVLLGAQQKSARLFKSRRPQACHCHMASISKHTLNLVQEEGEQRDYKARHEHGAKQAQHIGQPDSTRSHRTRPGTTPNIENDGHRDDQAALCVPCTPLQMCRIVRLPVQRDRLREFVRCINLSVMIITS